MHTPLILNMLANFKMNLINSVIILIVNIWRNTSHAYT